MNSDIPTHQIESIGWVAGEIWSYLNEYGSVTLSKLAREIDSPRDLIMQGVGWLAREGKVQFEERPRSKILTLSEPEECPY